jgi:hypothetical protein
MGIKNVEILIKLLFFNYARRNLIDLELFFMFVDSEFVEELFLLHLHVQ